MENTTPEPIEAAGTVTNTKLLKKVKATATSPVYAVFDIVKLEGRDVITGSIGFVDQFGVERMAKTAGEKGVLNLGKHVLAIFAGQVEVYEPTEEQKAQIAKQDLEKTKEVQGEILNAYKTAPEEGK